MMDSNILFLFDEIVLFDRWAAQATSVDDEALRWNKVFGGKRVYSFYSLLNHFHFLFLEQTDSPYLLF